MLESKGPSIKMKKSYVISLIIIGLLVIILMLLGYVKVLINNNPKNIYAKLINNFAGVLINQLYKYKSYV